MKKVEDLVDGQSKVIKENSWFRALRELRSRGRQALREPLNSTRVCGTERRPANGVTGQRRNAVDKGHRAMEGEVCPKMCHRSFTCPCIALHSTAMARSRGRHKQLMMQ